MNQFNKMIVDHLRCPDDLLQIGTFGELSAYPGFFNFGSDLICFGKCSAFTPSRTFSRELPDALEYARVEQGSVSLPFYLSEVIESLRREKYITALRHEAREWSQNRFFRMGYYVARPFLPVPVRKHLQRFSLRGWHKHPFPRWPVDTTVEQIIESVLVLILRAGEHQAIPFIWFWPEAKQGCALMTHDVETTAGRDFCETLMDIDDSFGIKASFQVVPEERYKVPMRYLEGICKRGFEVNVQDLNHDGRLFDNFEEFQCRTKVIKEYAAAFNARGFRSAVLYRNVDWLNSLPFEYDMSVPNVAHLDPQHGGCCTIFPYFAGDILEIPVTVTQDYTLFHIFRDYSIELWREQTSRILERHGVMNFIVHPDYVTRDREMRVFKDLLAYLADLRAKAGLWTPLPRELSEWWRQRNGMRIVKNGNDWEIAGAGKERARLAYARLENGKLVYDIALPSGKLERGAGMTPSPYRDHS
ncbi:MAG: hypothetical protein WAO35_16480 [Terriglobia bacterium]